MAYTKFDVWKESEGIAMHFNELLMQLRLRALAAVGFIVSLAGLAGKTASGEINWIMMSVVLGVLLISWIAIFLIDNFYYKQLLLGAVDAIVDLEKTTDGDAIKLDLSRKVGAKASAEWPVYWFYSLTGIMLFVLLMASLNLAGVLGNCWCNL